MTEPFITSLRHALSEVKETQKITPAQYGEADFLIEQILDALSQARNDETTHPQEPTDDVLDASDIEGHDDLNAKLEQGLKRFQKDSQKALDSAREKAKPLARASVQNAKSLLDKFEEKLK